jgi:hypothetical protein
MNKDFAHRPILWHFFALFWQKSTQVLCAGHHLWLTSANLNLSDQKTALGGDFGTPPTVYIGDPLTPFWPLLDQA